MIRSVINFARRIHTLERKLNCLLAKLPNDEIQYATINKTHFRVSPHWFWREFSEKGWEPKTYELMRATLHEDSVYIDVGAWVGPTILYAAELGVKSIYAIEANPLTYRYLSETISFNKALATVNLTHACVTDGKTPFANFGGRSGPDTSSISSTRGSDWIVRTTTLHSYLSEHRLEHVDFIKVDIEGAETLLEQDLLTLSKVPSLTILLSLHPPMWTDKSSDCEKMMESLAHFAITDINGGNLDRAEIYRRITSEESHPAWGTEFGNFFEIVLRTQCHKDGSL